MLRGHDEGGVTFTQQLLTIRVSSLIEETTVLPLLPSSLAAGAQKYVIPFRIVTTVFLTGRLLD